MADDKRVKLDDKQESGVGFITEVMGDAFGDAFREAASADRFGADIARMAASACFHDAWRHPGLTRQQKSLAIITTMIALKAPGELKNHVKIGLANGLTSAEIEGLLIQLAPYVGFASIAGAQSAVIEALREAGVAPDDVRTAEERGLI